ncbi:hypothetical protein ACWEV3_15745 [Saccharopolyspora sp. NPDC003752]
MRDRPEVLVTVAGASSGPVAPGSDIEPVLLAVEAKARHGYGPQELKSAIVALLECQPWRILGASYFSSTGADQLHIQRFGGTTIGVGEALVPGSRSASATAAWLDEMWQALPRPQVTIVAADVSASMPARAAKERLQVMAELPGNVPRPRWADSLAETDLLFLSTFGGPVPGLTSLPEFSAEAIVRAKLPLTPHARGQNLGQAIKEWQAGLGNVPIRRIQLNVHLITDGRWTDSDLEALDEYRLAGAHVHLHIVDEPEHPSFREELRQLMVE